MDFKKLFCELTSHTYPSPHEKELLPLLPKDIQEDEFGNYFIKIGDSNSMFTCHLDTATSAYTKVNHVFDGKFIKTDGKSILGADDKAGTVVMLWMIENKIPGLYYFFLAEEIGCQGSKKLSAKWKENKELFGKINKVVAFDRKAYKSVITHQFGRTCSDEFAKDLATKLNALDSTFVYEADPTGLYTDSAQFKSIIPECTNISVGYFDQHMMVEKQDIEFLEKLCNAVIKIDWDALVVKRDPEKDNDYGTRYQSDYDDYAYGNYSSNNYSRNNRNQTWNSNHSSYRHNSNNSFNKGKDKIEIEFWYDDKFQYLSEFSTKGTDLVEVKLCEERVAYETKLIAEMFYILKIDYVNITWDGLKCEITSNYKDNLSVLTRSDLYEFLPELKYV